MRTVDGRGRACPEPVILTRQALRETNGLLAIVDDDTAPMNVRRMAEKSASIAEALLRSDRVISV